jgi:hypothetical protein
LEVLPNADFAVRSGPASCGIDDGQWIHNGVDMGGGMWLLCRGVSKISHTFHLGGEEVLGET